MVRMYRQQSKVAIIGSPSESREKSRAASSAAPHGSEARFRGAGSGHLGHSFLSSPTIILRLIPLPKRRS